MRYSNGIEISWSGWPICPSCQREITNLALFTGPQPQTDEEHERYAAAIVEAHREQECGA